MSQLSQTSGTREKRLFFFDMLVIGILITLAGFVESLTFQRVFSAAMLVIQSIYLFLDVQTADTPLGNSLYKGPYSLAPVVIGFAFTLLFLTLTISALRYRAAPGKKTESIEHT